MFDYLPPELWEEIFHRLPLKSIVICTSVCKAWKSLITHHYFITEHHTRTLQTKHVECSFFLQLSNLHILEGTPYSGYNHEEYYSVHSNDHQQIEHISILKLPFSDDKKHWIWTLVGLYNGMVCFVDYEEFDIDSTTIMICNPSIRKYVMLPNPKPIVSFYEKPEILYGFGYNSRNNDFKVLRIVTDATFDNRQEISLQVEIYSLASDSWRDISARAPPFLRCRFLIDTSQMLENGRLHWVVYHKIKEDSKTRMFILSFDVVEETFGELMLPHCLTNVVYMPVSVVVGWDSLAVHGFYSESGELFHNIWMMKEYGIVESWTPVFRVPFSSKDTLKPLAIRGTTGEVVLLKRHTGDIILMDRMKGIVKDLEHRPYFRGSASAGFHVETLFLIDKVALSY